METTGMGWMGVVLMAAATFPLAFILARACLSGVVRLVTTSDHRSLR